MVRWLDFLKMNDAGLNIVHRTDNRNARVCPVSFQMMELMAQRRHAVCNVGCHALMYQSLARVAAAECLLFLRFVFEALYDREDMFRFVFARFARHGFDSPATLVPHDHYRAHAEVRHSVFNAGKYVLFFHNIARIANDEQITDTFVENDFRRDTRIRTGNNDGVWMLAT